jgi:hypothetical protein
MRTTRRIIDDAAELVAVGGRGREHWRRAEVHQRAAARALERGEVTAAMFVTLRGRCIALWTIHVNRPVAADQGSDPSVTAIEDDCSPFKAVEPPPSGGGWVPPWTADEVQRARGVREEAALALVASVEKETRPADELLQKLRRRRKRWR